MIRETSGTHLSYSQTIIEYIHHTAVAESIFMDLYYNCGTYCTAIGHAPKSNEESVGVYFLRMVECRGFI